ncbi:MAG: HD domain-containing protein [Firmicutes bacterium]|nr:HD domain-containing protein [Bacillota bacterium]
MAEADRLQKQIEFILEIDKLKEVYRRSFVTGSKKAENDAEHSWHLALMSILLLEYARTKQGEPDLLRVLKMVLVHDLVEIDAGDTYCYDEEAAGDKRLREEKAAERLFNLLPPDQAAEFRSLWDEFEQRRTPEALYAAALDRLQPVLLNYHTQGRSWKMHGITAEQVLERNSLIKEGAPELWAYVREIIRKAVEKGYLSGGRDR